MPRKKDVKIIQIKLLVPQAEALLAIVDREIGGGNLAPAERIRYKELSVKLDRAVTGIPSEHTKNAHQDRDDKGLFKKAKAKAKPVQDAVEIAASAEKNIKVSKNGWREGRLKKQTAWQVIYSMEKNGFTDAQITEKYRLSPDAVLRIRNREVYNDVWAEVDAFLQTGPAEGRPYNPLEVREELRT